MQRRSGPPSARVVCLLAAAGFWLLFAGPAQAAERLVPLNGRWVTPAEAASYQEPPRLQAPEYGTASTSAYSIGACEATQRNTNEGMFITNCQQVTPTLTSASQLTIAFPIHLPTGALITEVTEYYHDSYTLGGISAGLYQVGHTGTLTLVVGLGEDNGTPGDVASTFPVAPPHQVDNSAGPYQILVILQSTNATEFTSVYGYTVKYQLQVSPAPVTATFNDVPTTHPFFRFIEALAASGITAGCGGGNFCPDTALTRGQMAVFLSIALGLHFPN